MNIGGPELIFILVIWLAIAVPPILALVDLAGRPAEAFDAVGQSRVVWILLLIVGLLACGVLGIVAGMYYLLSVRPKLDAAVS